MSTQVHALESANVARFVAQRAASAPDALAVAAPEAGDFETWTWRELERNSNRVAQGLLRIGLRPGDRTCVFVKPGLPWTALIHGLFKLGAVPVLIDPGIGRSAVLAAIERVEPRALIAVPRLHLARALRASAFKSVEISVSAGHRLWTDASLHEWLHGEWLHGSEADSRAIERSSGDVAAILFTSGSTGPAKGVVYEHGMFRAQVEMLRELYRFEPGRADLACFPLFALFGPALGLASVFPDMDFTHPARCEPSRIVEAIERFHVRSSFGSPAIWRRVVPWCESRGRRLDTLEQLMIAGAPVEADLVRRARSVIARDGEVFTPYGATEALPVAHVEGVRLSGPLGERAARGEGTCVGREVPGIQVRLIRIEDGPIASWSDELLVGPGEAGEICVRGPNVTREYERDSAATTLAKIRDGDGFWHRMGDVGRFDADGRLWFLGRKSHRVQTSTGTLFTVPLENVIERHPAVGRCALVGVGETGRERPTLIVETSSGSIPPGAGPRARLCAELKSCALSIHPCAALEHVLYKRDFPLDPRHQAKIDRTALKRWAEDMLA